MRDRLIRLTTNIAIVAILLLIYWAFCFAVAAVFSFNFFNDNTTRICFSFGLIILIVLGGALLLNFILNLSKIADAVFEQKVDEFRPTRGKYMHLIWFVLSFPFLFFVIYLGNYYASAAKQQYLLESAKAMIAHNSDEMERFADYSFDEVYINKISELLNIISREDRSIPSVSLIIEDYIEQKRVFIALTQHSNLSQAFQDHLITKKDFIYSSSLEELNYLYSVFKDNNSGYFFTAHNGFYEFYYPVKTSKRIIVLYFTDRSRYGKMDD